MSNVIATKLENVTVSFGTVLDTARRQTTHQRIEAEPTQNSPLTLIPAPDLRESGSVECCLVQAVRQPHARDMPAKHADRSPKSPGDRTNCQKYTLSHIYTHDFFLSNRRYVRELHIRSVKECHGREGHSRYYVR